MYRTHALWLALLLLFTACKDEAPGSLPQPAPIEPLDPLAEPADLDAPDDLEGARVGGIRKVNGGTNGANDYCNGTRCLNGEGDCDGNGECAVGLICPDDNGGRFLQSSRQEVCVPSHCINRLQDGNETGIDCGGPPGDSCGSCEPLCSAQPPDGDRDRCTYHCKCGPRVGDCDAHDNCTTGYCGTNNGAQFGLPADFDVCVGSTCQNGRQDPGEGGIDCGGDCAPCPAPPDPLSQISLAEPNAVIERVVDDANIAYLAVGPAGVIAYDISNPAAPVRKGGFSVGASSYCKDLVKSSDYLYVACTDRQLILNVSDPNDITLVSEIIQPSVHSCAKLDDALYVGSNNDVLIYDVSNPASPIFIRALGSGSSTQIIRVAVDYALRRVYCLYAGGRLFISSAVDPFNPTFLNALPGFPNATDLVVRGGFAYCGYDGRGLVIYDIRNPLAPRQIYWDGGSRTIRIDVRGTNLACIYADRRFVLADASDPRRLIILRSSIGSSIPTAVYLTTGGWAFVGQGASSVLYDVPPFVEGTCPHTGSRGICPSAPFSVFFSQEMNPSSIGSSSVQLLDRDSNPLPATIGYANAAASIVPGAPLALGIYSIRVTTGAENTRGTSLAPPFGFTSEFTVTPICLSTQLAPSSVLGGAAASFRHTVAAPPGTTISETGVRIGALPDPTFFFATSGPLGSGAPGSFNSSWTTPIVNTPAQLFFTPYAIVSGAIYYGQTAWFVVLPPGGAPQDAGVASDSGVAADGGAGADTGVASDTGVAFDAGVPPDAGFADASPPPDTGVDVGFADALPPPDTGVPPDLGFADAAPPPDTGVPPDVGFADALPPPDAGFADALPPPDTGVPPDLGFADALPPPDTGVVPDAGFPDASPPPDTGVNPDGGPVCGNTVLEQGEACDDGNLLDGDGCQSDCTVLPGTYYVTDFTMNGRTRVYSGGFQTGNYQWVGPHQIPLVVSDFGQGPRIRQSGYLPGVMGNEYLTNGLPTPIANSIALNPGDEVQDAAFNKTLNEIYVLKVNNAQVWVYGPNYEGGAMLFTADAGDVGITYDSGNDRIWTSNVNAGTGLVTQWTRSGLRLGSFSTAADSQNAALAYDPSDDTLWMYGVSSVRIRHYSKTGQLLGSFDNNTGFQFRGGEIHAIASLCGNGVPNPGEQCDDGNRDDGDTCESNCTAPFCGNRILDVGEDCDDGNQVNGDGCNTTCTVTPGTYFVTDNSGGDGFTHAVVNGVRQYSYRWRRANQRPIAVGDFGAGIRVRQVGANQGNSGDEYSPTGVPTGLEYTIDYGGDAALDAAYDPNRNVIYVLRVNSGQVWQYDATYGNPQLLFTADSGDWGIAYDPVRDRIWTSNWAASSAQVVEWTRSGLRLRAFWAADANNAALAFDSSDPNPDNHTLWMYGSSNQLRRYTRNGQLLSTFPTPSGQVLGGEIAQEPSLCGNGLPNAGEQCDDGNEIDGDACESDCRLPVCGNRIQDAGEDCDDGNLVNGDGCNAGCVITPGTYFLTDQSGGLGSTHALVNGVRQYSYRWVQSNQRPIAVGDFGGGVRVRQAGANQGNTGDEYSPGGVPTGVTSVIDHGGDAAVDAAYDPNRNVIYVLRINSSQVWQYDASYSNPQFLFNADSGDFGIAYDPVRDRIWTSNWNASSAQVVEWTRAGLRLRSFSAADANNAALAFDSTDPNPDNHSLWMYGSSNQIRRYSLSGQLLGTFPTPSGVVFGGDMIQAASLCGDGVPNAGEQCDDGNKVDGDACESDCKLPVCGNRIQDTGEDCDDGNLVNGDGCNAGCVLTPGTYFLTDNSGGLGSTHALVNGVRQYSYRWRQSNQRVVVVNDFGGGMRVRQAGANQGNIGDEYSPAGVPTGVTSAIDLGGDAALDAAYDPNRNVIYVLRVNSSQVWQYDSSFANPVFLFTADSGDFGIAYDPVRDRIWTSNWNASSAQVVEWTRAGLRVRAFSATDANNAALAFDSTDPDPDNHSLWMYGSSNQIRRYSRNGQLLGTFATPSGVVFGGEIRQSASLCGNGVPNAGEQCDDGNKVDGDACESDCKLPICGNRVQDAGEECDDGNLVDGDGCNAGCVLTPGTYFVTDNSGGLGSTHALVNGVRQYSYRWRQSNQRPIVVADFGGGVRVRQGGANQGNIGDEYSPAGVPTGLTSAIDLGGDAALDAAYDPNRNVIYVLRVSSSQVWQYDSNYANPSLLFTADSGDFGIAYDPVRDRIWTSNWNGSSAQVVEWTRAGLRLRAFSAADANNAALAFDSTDPNPANHSLWMYGSSNQIRRYSRSGQLLGTFATPSGNVFGGEIRQNASLCGNGLPNAGEQCDDGNKTDGDACESDCRFPTCGNGIQDSGEACDDGNATNGDGCETSCSLTPGTYFLTDNSGGLGSTHAVVGGVRKYSYRWVTANQRAIAAGNFGGGTRVRQANANDGSSGNEYSPAGVPTGATQTLATGGDTVVDAAFNPITGQVYTLRIGSSQVFAHDTSFGGAALLFTANPGDFGVTYDSGTNTIWTSNWNASSGRVQQWTLGGTPLTFFTAADANNAALAYDPTTQTLWMYGSSNQLRQYSRAGVLLGTFPTPSGTVFGGEFAQ